MSWLPSERVQGTFVPVGGRSLFMASLAYWNSVYPRLFVEGVASVWKTPLVKSPNWAKNFRFREDAFACSHLMLRSMSPASGPAPPPMGSASICVSPSTAIVARSDAGAEAAYWTETVGRLLVASIDKQPVKSVPVW